MEHTPNCVAGREYYKPFQYPWAAEIAMEHEQIHWVPTEVSLADDVIDWEKNLTEEERHLLTQLFRFFTQADVDVMGGYAKQFLPLFSNHPELAGMFGSIAAREWIHTWGYSLLLETVGIPETEYQAFLEYEEMSEKEDYVLSFDMSTKQSVAETLAVYGAFVEGIQLFSTFAILMNFPRFGKMKGMGKIIEWSIRDEGYHIEACVQMFHQWCLENQGYIDHGALEDSIRDICANMVDLEDKFIDLAFGEVNDIEGLTKDDLKKYIRYLADIRLNQLGYDVMYEEEDPLGWLDIMIYGEDHTNFFENRVTEYPRGTIQENEELDFDV